MPPTKYGKRSLSPASTDVSSPTTCPKRAREDTETKTDVAVGGWTPNKRARIMDKIIVAGFKGFSNEELAKEFGVTRTQIAHAFQAGRKGNFRDKAVAAVKGE
ncbi:hypothetical protein P7C73_g2626, partial [Tremellales sp. Uapishka_1]